MEVHNTVEVTFIIISFHIQGYSRPHEKTAVHRVVPVHPVIIKIGSDFQAAHFETAINININFQY